MKLAFVHFFEEASDLLFNLNIHGTNTESISSTPPPRWLIIWRLLSNKGLVINKMRINLFYFAMTGFMAGLIVVANDFGTAAIIVCITYLMYILLPIDLLTSISTMDSSP